MEAFTPGFQFGTPGACHSGNKILHYNIKKKYIYIYIIILLKFKGNGVD